MTRSGQPRGEVRVRPGAVARVYARTLLQTAERAGAVESVTEGLAGFEGSLSAQPTLRRFLVAPQIPADDKRALLERAFGERLHPLVVRFLQLVITRRRETLLTEIAAAWRELLDTRANRQSATVTTAVPADEATLAQIRAALERTTGKTIALETAIDPRILGGVVIRTGDLVMDTSVRSRIAALRHRLMTAGTARMDVR